ncbi:MAG: uridine phosphorylase [Monoglobales bacterium]
MDKLYHIGLEENPGAEYAILPGDPGRVEKIAKYLDNPIFLNKNREYTTYIGSLNGRNVLVTSTGIGGPSTAIAVEELYQAGVKTFIRVGTCGGMQTDVLSGDLIIASGAVRMDGTSIQYTPIEFPAIASHDVAWAMAEAAKRLDKRHHIGVVQSKDSFYGQHSPERMPSGFELQNKWDAWIKAGALASEMECATLYIVCSMLKARCGAVLGTVWNQERAKMGLSNPEVHNEADAIECAVEAVKILIDKDKLSE